ncbi:MAG: hypothetical protein OHK0012_02450 [Synechococcales cyanobacterium]
MADIRQRLGWVGIALVAVACQRPGSLDTEAFFFAADTQLPGQWTATTPRDPRDDRSVVTFPLALSQPQTVVLGVSSPVLDAYVEITDSQGRILAADDDHGPDVNPLVAVPLNPGSYTIRVLNTEPGSTGSFTVGYSLINPWLGIPTQSGLLKEGDPGHPEDGSWMHTFTLPGQPRQLLLASLQSSEFTPVLQIIDPRGEAVAVAGPQLDGDSALLAVFLERRGEYTIRVTSLAPGEGGNYRLQSVILSGDQLQSTAVRSN